MTNQSDSAQRELTPEYIAAREALTIARWNYDAHLITKKEMDEAEKLFRQIREKLMAEALEV